MIRLLHVEDDPDIREIAALALSLTGEFTIKQCESGLAALEAPYTFTPDVLLLDMMMPGMSGMEVLQRLRALEPYQDVPAIFMTARAQPAEMQELWDAGAVEVIIKPFDPMTLTDQIKAALSTA